MSAVTATVNSPAPRRSTMFLSYVHSFRGLAIALIVGGHCLHLLDWSERPTTHALLQDLILNGTILFVFAAGFFFEHLAGRFRYRDYLWKKAKYVLLPYLILSIPPIWYSVFYRDAAAQYAQLGGHSQAYQVIWFLMVGGAHFNFPLWFVPMISLFYLGGPAFAMVHRHPAAYTLLPVLILLATLAHRPEYPNLDTLSLALYFLPCYLLGMWACRNRLQVESAIRRHWWALLGLFAACLGVQFFGDDHHGNYEAAHLFSQEHGLIDWMYPQKLLMCFLLLGLCHRFESRLDQPLRTLADTSFPVFFLHGYAIFAIQTLHLVSGVPGGVVQWLVLSAAVTLACVGAAQVVRRTLGPRSRLVIGA